MNKNNNTNPSNDLHGINIDDMDVMIDNNAYI